MPGLETLTWDKLNGAIQQLKDIANNLGDVHFATYANIAATKITDTVVTQSDVSVTHKTTSRQSDISRLDQNADMWLPYRIGNISNGDYIEEQRDKGALSFFINNTEETYVNDSGWTNGTAPAGTAVAKISIEFNSTLSFWIIKLNGSAIAYIDALNAAGVFINTYPTGTRTASTGANIDFANAGRIDFRNNGAVIGYIDSTGAHEGSP